VSVPALAYTAPEHAIKQGLAVYQTCFPSALTVYIDLNRGPGILFHALTTGVRGTHVWSPRFTGLKSSALKMTLRQRGVGTAFIRDSVIIPHTGYFPINPPAPPGLPYASVTPQVLSAHSWITLYHSSVTPLHPLGLPRSTLWLPYDSPPPRVDCLPSRLRGLGRKEMKRKEEKKSNLEATARLHFWVTLRPNIPSFNYPSHSPPT
jgi:hypothetical protein